MFTQQSLWTPQNVASLVRFYTRNQTSKGGTFFDKLESQLEPAPSSAKQLVAEMLWVMYLFRKPRWLKHETKLKHIHRVWNWSGAPIPDAAFELDEALAVGVGSQGGHQFLPWDLCFFIHFMEAWTNLRVSQRENRLADPWKFAELLDEKDETKKRQFRHVLLYLLFPNHFEPFSKGTPKRSIVREFSKKLGENIATFDFDHRIAVDQQIAIIRKRLQERGHASDFDFREEPYRQVWLPGSQEGDSDSLPSEESKQFMDGTDFEAGTGQVSPEPVLPSYSQREALRDLFLSEGDFDRVVKALNRKKNVILEGPPGVGKTFIAKRIAYRVIGYKVPEKVRMIQFHQNYAYEDFIQGYRPKEGGGFELRNGIFHTFCREATANPDERYVFIIDEVNRGNLSKIFGELMMLIEADKRGSEYAVHLTYSPDSEPFWIPENLFMIGMMNTADRSLAMVDYALRRRFAFHRLRPAYERDQFSDHLNAKGVGQALVDRIVKRLSALNKKIRGDRSLGGGFEIGHSFFCPVDDDEELDEAWYEAIVRHEIKPLLREYWFDNPDVVERQIQKLLS